MSQEKMSRPDIAPPPERGRLGGGLRQFRELPPVVVSRSRRLRAEMTEAEKKLWHYLRFRQMSGHKFRRQHPIGPYIADFVCIKRKLVVELDGGQHATRRSYDRRRDAFLRQKGYTVLRFWNHGVLEDMEAVWMSIARQIERFSRAESDPHLASPFQGEEKR